MGQGSFVEDPKDICRKARFETRLLGDVCCRDRVSKHVFSAFGEFDLENVVSWGQISRHASVFEKGEKGEESQQENCRGDAHYLPWAHAEIETPLPFGRSQWLGKGMGKEVYVSGSGSNVPPGTWTLEQEIGGYAFAHLRLRSVAPSGPIRIFSARLKENHSNEIGEKPFF